MAAFMRFRYGPAEAQVLDHYFPAGPPRPVHLALVHGGGWAGGDTQYGVLPSYATAAQAAGYTVSSVGYRLAGPGVDWNVQVADVAAGVAYARATIGAPARVVLLGESAGGHLAAIAALTGAVHAAGLVALYGAHDLQALDLDTPGHPWSTRLDFEASLRACLGGPLPPEDPVKAALASPDYQALLTTWAAPNVLLVHSSDDPTIGCAQSRRLVAALVGRQPASVTYVERPGADHGGPPYQQPGPVADLVMAFLARAA
jgi:acetyl esterase/lipase